MKSKILVLEVPVENYVHEELLESGEEVLDLAYLAMLGRFNLEVTEHYVIVTETK